MRFALVTHVVGRNDGQGRVNFEVARALLDHGHELTVIAERCDPEIHEHGRATWVRVAPKAPTRILKDIVFAMQSARWLRRHRQQFDLVQANGFVTFAAADVVAAHFVHTAWLKNPAYSFRWSTLGPQAWYQRFYTVFHARMEKRAFRRARRCVAVSQAIARELEDLGVPAAKIRVVYNGIETQEFLPGVPEREAFGLPQERSLALFVGDLMTPRKNLVTVLQALAMTPDIDLVIAGKGKADDIQEKARAYGVADRVRFLGTTREMPKLMRSVDVFVFPSWYEPYGMVALEAASVGLPVVLSRNTGAAETLASVAQVTDAPGNVEQLAAGMRAAIANAGPQRSKALRACADEWTIERTNDGYLKVYEELLQEGATQRQEGSHAHSA